jgi:cytochrome c-type biogenesis protein CcmH/NrfF
VRGRALAALLLSLALTAPATALAVTPRTSLHDIENEVMCNVCGTPLNVADSPQADRERAFINTLIARGYTKKQVKDAMVKQFGAGILDVPSGHGFDLAAYLVPGLGILVAGGVIGVAVVRWRRTRPASLATPAGPTSKDSALLRDDLERYDL